MLTPNRAEALLEQVADLHTIVLLIARRVHEGDEPMTATQRLALIEITGAGAIRPRELARRLETTPATVTRALDALEKWKFVKRQPDPDDGRCLLIAPTARGRRWADRRAALVREVLSQVSPSVAPARLVKDLAALNEALRHATGEGAGRGVLRAS